MYTHRHLSVSVALVCRIQVFALLRPSVYCRKYPQKIWSVQTSSPVLYAYRLKPIWSFWSRSLGSKVHDSVLSLWHFLFVSWIQQVFLHRCSNRVHRVPGFLSSRPNWLWFNFLSHGFRVCLQCFGSGIIDSRSGPGSSTLGWIPIRI
jgi:hypothetical protein